MRDGAGVPHVRAAQRPQRDGRGHGATRYMPGCLYGEVEMRQTRHGPICVVLSCGMQTQKDRHPPPLWLASITKVRCPQHILLVRCPQHILLVRCPQHILLVRCPQQRILLVRCPQHSSCRLIVTFAFSSPALAYSPSGSLSSFPPIPSSHLPFPLCRSRFPTIPFVVSYCIFYLSCTKSNNL